MTPEKTHFEVVLPLKRIRSKIKNEDIARIAKRNCEVATGLSFEVREVAD